MITPKDEATYSLPLMQFIYDKLSFSCLNRSKKIFQNISNFHQTIRRQKNTNLSVEIFENLHSDHCTTAVFHGSPKSLCKSLHCLFYHFFIALTRTSLFILVRCEPPVNVSFSRSDGELRVTVTWKQEDAKLINEFAVRYKVLDSPNWDEVRRKLGFDFGIWIWLILSNHTTEEDKHNIDTSNFRCYQVNDDAYPYNTSTYTYQWHHYDK